MTLSNPYSENQGDESMNVKMVVAAHKPYWIPNDPMYVPVQVGAEGKPSIDGYVPDDTGQNISKKNDRYCELTGLYWAWKNLGADYIGLAHYRRQFAGSGEKGTLTGQEAERLLQKAPLVLPRRRNYFIESIYSHYEHTFGEEQLIMLKGAIKDASPSYLVAFDTHMNERSGHMYNMLIARSDLLDRYLGWLFPLLERVEGEIDFSEMAPFEARCIGRLSELLLDVWVQKNQVNYVECPIRDMEPVNWLKKGSSFLKAKYLGSKYKESF